MSPDWLAPLRQVSRVPGCQLPWSSSRGSSSSPSPTAGSRQAGSVTRVLEVPLDGLPDALDGVRIGHLSDFHLGAPLSRGNRASERPRGGSRSGDPTSSVSPETSSPILEASRGSSAPRGPRAPVRRARQPRRRRHTRSVLAGGGAPRPRAHEASRRRGRIRRARAGNALQSWASTRKPIGRSRLGRTSSPNRGQRFGCCSAISPDRRTDSAAPRSI